MQLLPQHGCNAGTRWAHSPLGDTPEVMAWDSHGNKYVDDSMARHIAVTRHLPSTGYNDDWELDPEGKNPHPLKFTRATPKQQDRGYLRLLHPVTGVTPTPTELVTDRDRCWTRNMRKIWDVRGIRVPGNGNRNGRRAVDSVDHNVDRRGGAYRPLGPSQSRRPLHADAEKAQKERMGVREAAFTAWKAR